MLQPGTVGYDTTMAREQRVWVWLEPDDSTQHLTAPPESDVTLAWTGQTLCGQQGGLRWVSPENVDVAKSCARCVDAQGSYSPPLQGEHLGPV
jgi:hypothetical protein